MAVSPSAEGTQVLPKLQVTLEQGSRVPQGPRRSKRMRLCWLHCARCSSHSLL